MKSFINSKLTIISLSLILIVGCKSNLLPKVKSPSYIFYNYGKEKGYKVYFEIPNNTMLPKAVVINKVMQTISKPEKAENKYSVNVISQSSAILGFKPEIVDKENGIFFEENGKEIFIPVSFKLIR